MSGTLRPTLVRRIFLIPEIPGGLKTGLVISVDFTVTNPDSGTGVSSAYQEKSRYADVSIDVSRVPFFLRRTLSLGSTFSPSLTLSIGG
jgi:hypothetical protein